MQGFKLGQFCGRREMNTGFWWGNMKRKKKHVGNLGINGRIVLKCILKGIGGCELN
jgi:hypothetical protein